ncbi:hypothetical protein EG329_000862 [Mollisiaceae sp. DMI_Dod_QoI]|nr:hypothetical protein EG329_000862 [Helotiales sp. DMI_Dod_QoI]
MFRFIRASIVLLAVSALAFAAPSSHSEATPFTLTASSPNDTLNGMHAYLYPTLNDLPNALETVMLFTSDSTVTPTNFTLNNTGNFLAHTSYTGSFALLEANTNNDAYDEVVLFSSVEVVATGQNPPTCHKSSNYLSCSVKSEAMTRLSKMYVCPPGVGYDTYGGALKIGNAVPEGCSALQLNITNCVGTC